MKEQPDILRPNIFTANPLWRRAIDVHHALARNAFLSAAIHFIVIFSLLTIPVFWHAKQRPRDIIPIDLTLSSGGGGVKLAGSAAEKSKPAAIIVMPAWHDETIRVSPKEKIKKKNEIKISKKTVQRIYTTVLAKLSESEIKKAFASSLALNASVKNSTGTGRASHPFGWYYSLVRAVMHDAWQQPSTLSAKIGLSTEVLVRIKRDGQVVQRKIIHPSGNALMDSSVMDAIGSVARLPEPPFGMGGSHADITINFVLTDAAP